MPHITDSLASTQLTDGLNVYPHQLNLQHYELADMTSRTFLYVAQSHYTVQSFQAAVLPYAPRSLDTGSNPADHIPS